MLPQDLFLGGDDDDDDETNLDASFVPILDTIVAAAAVAAEAVAGVDDDSVVSKLSESDTALGDTSSAESIFLWIGSAAPSIDKLLISSREAETVDEQAEAAGDENPMEDFDVRADIPRLIPLTSSPVEDAAVVVDVWFLPDLLLLLREDDDDGVVVCFLSDLLPLRDEDEVCLSDLLSLRPLLLLRREELVVVPSVFLASPPVTLTTTSTTRNKDSLKFPFQLRKTITCLLNIFDFSFQFSNTFLSIT